MVMKYIFRECYFKVIVRSQEFKTAYRKQDFKSLNVYAYVLKSKDNPSLIRICRSEKQFIYVLGTEYSACEWLF